VRDVAHRKAIEARLEHAALHDPLTGLANRTLFRDRLQQEIARSRRTGAHFALFWIDLDRFKEVNDKLGHEAGDIVLRALTERLKAAVRTEDTVARIGGDEFVVLRAADGAAGGATAAADLASRLVAAMDQTVDYAGVPVRIGLSVGVALTQTEGFEADRLLRVADEALYRAKNAGRGRYVVGG
jgi:diguanylate cyclase (GGDEF)-like protein